MALLEHPRRRRRVSTSLTLRSRPVGDRRICPAWPRCARQAAANASTATVPGALTLAQAAAGRRARSLRFGLRLRSLRSLRPGPWRPGARSARALARQAGRRFARSPTVAVVGDACADAVGRRSTSGRVTLWPAPTAAACGAPVPASEPPLRCALRLPPTPRVLRCAPASLRCEREPPGLRCAAADCVAPSPPRFKPAQHRARR